MDEVRLLSASTGHFMPTKKRTLMETVTSWAADLLRAMGSVAPAVRLPAAADIYAELVAIAGQLASAAQDRAQGWLPASERAMVDAFRRARVLGAASLREAHALLPDADVVQQHLSSLLAGAQSAAADAQRAFTDSLGAGASGPLAVGALCLSLLLLGISLAQRPSSASANPAASSPADAADPAGTSSGTASEALFLYHGKGNTVLRSRSARRTQVTPQLFHMLARPSVTRVGAEAGANVAVHGWWCWQNAPELGKSEIGAFYRILGTGGLGQPLVLLQSGPSYALSRRVMTQADLVTEAAAAEAGERAERPAGDGRIIIQLEDEGFTSDRIRVTHFGSNAGSTLAYSVTTTLSREPTGEGLVCAQD